ncbi:MAG: hypothetical protein M1834_001049 [Cirrosporium novae-zelandiae]|nr:MAG: hypothetical protein M1834_001049 [Cirrosporium novae-zelandiae]
MSALLSLHAPPKVGSTFPDYSSFIEVINDWSVRAKFDYKVNHKDTTRAILICADKISNCPWRIRANLDENGAIFISVLNPQHTCQNTRERIKRAVPTRQRWVQGAVARHLHVTEATKPQEILECLKEKYGEEVELKVAQRIKKGLLKKDAQHQQQLKQSQLQQPFPPQAQMSSPLQYLPDQSIQSLQPISPLSTMSTSQQPQPNPVFSGGRIAQIIHLKPEAVAGYKECHSRVWPEVLDQIKQSNIADYSIFYDNDRTLFATFRYIGNDWEGDMKRMAENPKVQAWWSMTDAMQPGLRNMLLAIWGVMVFVIALDDIPTEGILGVKVTQ